MSLERGNRKEEQTERLVRSSIQAANNTCLFVQGICVLGHVVVAAALADRVRGFEWMLLLEKPHRLAVKAVWCERNRKGHLVSTPCLLCTEQLAIH